MPTQRPGSLSAPYQQFAHFPETGHLHPSLWSCAVNAMPSTPHRPHATSHPLRHPLQEDPAHRPWAYSLLVKQDSLTSQAPCIPLRSQNSASISTCPHPPRPPWVPSMTLYQRLSASRHKFFPSVWRLGPALLSHKPLWLFFSPSPEETLNKTQVWKSSPQNQRRISVMLLNFLCFLVSVYLLVPNCLSARSLPRSECSCPLKIHVVTS